MTIYFGGELHGGATADHINKAPNRKGDIIILTGDSGFVWYPDYQTNPESRRQEDYLLESRLKPNPLWLAVDGNHDNFDRLFSGEFSLVTLFGGQAYRIRKNVYYLKRGEIFVIEAKTYLAFGGAASHDVAPNPSTGWKGRVEGRHYWKKEVPSKEDFDNACRNLDRHDWKVDQVITHTLPSSMRDQFPSRNFPDPTEDILQSLIDKGLQFDHWHFGHLHVEKTVGKFSCHYDVVRQLD